MYNNNNNHQCECGVQVCRACFHGDAQSIVAFVRNLLEILMGFLQNVFHLKSSLDKTKYILIRVFGNVVVIFDYWFSNTKTFLCGI